MAKVKITPTSLKLSALDEASRTATFVASTTDPVRTVEWAKINGTWEEKEFFDAIVEWDFTRWQDNPIIPWVHKTDEMPVGKGLGAEWDGNVLTVRVEFAPDAVSKKAEEVWQALKRGFLRGVSVGFEPEILSEEDRNGVTYRNLKGTLQEVSIAPLPADPGALLDPREEEEERRRKVSAAASALASARKPKMDSGDDEPCVKIDAASRLDSARVERTQLGGIKVPARIARVGVLTYRRGGVERREYRPRDEVSRAESLASFEDAPVIDFFDHTGLVTPEDYRRKTVGHARNVRMDGDYVVADLVINDADTIKRIDNGDRIDTSAGYVTKDEHMPGVWKGEKYDLIQRNIFGNHIALCPPNSGRSGPDVGLRLDSNATGAWEAQAEEEKHMKLIKLDGKDFEFGSEEHIAKVEQLHSAEVSALKSEIATAKASADEARAKLDAKEAAAKAEEGDKEKEKFEFAKREKARIKRALRAARIMEEDDEEKLDSLLDLSDRDLMVKTLKHKDPKFDKADETEDYLRARFDAIEVPAKATIGDVVRDVDKVRLDDNTDPAEKSRLAMIERNRTAWKK